MATCRRLHLATVLALLASWGACTYGHRDTELTTFKPLVFPGEARLGGSALMIVDANDIAIGDDLERYDLHRSRVEIDVVGNAGTAPATIRSVFAVEAARATQDAEDRPNGWSMVALFDLPEAADGAFNPPYPLHAPLRLKVDGQLVPELEGVIWIVGEGGSPTSLESAYPLLPALEDLLEPRTMVRLRPRGEDSTGFDPTWTIGGLHAEIHYDSSCLESPEAFVGSNAAGGGATIGPPTVPAAPYPAGLEAVQVVLSHPAGFTLPIASALDPTRLGTGPILDIAFDRIGSCPGSLDQYVWVRGVQIMEPDGTERVARPFPSEIEALSFDGSEFFHLHYVDPGS